MSRALLSFLLVCATASGVVDGRGDLGPPSSSSSVDCSPGNVTCKFLRACESGLIDCDSRVSSRSFLPFNNEDEPDNMNIETFLDTFESTLRNLQKAVDEQLNAMNRMLADRGGDSSSSNVTAKVSPGLTSPPCDDRMSALQIALAVIVVVQKAIIGTLVWSHVKIRRMLCYKRRGTELGKEEDDYGDEDRDPKRDVETYVPLRDKTVYRPTTSAYP